jgi:acetyltransferase-like isoleucine patch superfamily enzyme
MKVFFLMIAAACKHATRRVYSMYRATAIKAGSGCSIAASVLVEGAGIIRLGNQVKLEDHVRLACGQGGSIELKSGANIGSHAQLVVSKDISLVLQNGAKIGAHTRCYINNQWFIGQQTSIATFCQLFSREGGCKGRLNIGDGCSIGDYSILDLSDDITIGHEVALGPRCTLYTHDHDYRQPGITAPWKGNPITKPIVIEDGAWIGSNVTILPGITIGKNALVAAGSVVTKNVAANAIVAGIPAKSIRNAV